MALDEQELQEQLFEDIGEIKDVLNIHSRGFEGISNQVCEVLEAVTKPVEGDSLYQVLHDIQAAIERNNDLLTRVEAGLAKIG